MLITDLFEAITAFPWEVYQTPETRARRAYPNLIYFHEVDKGGTSRRGNSRNSSVPNSGQRLGRRAIMCGR